MKAEFSRMMEGASDAELGRHAKVVAFKDSIKNSLPEGKFTAVEIQLSVNKCNRIVSKYH